LSFDDFLAVPLFSIFGGVAGWIAGFLIAANLWRMHHYAYGMKYNPVIWGILGFFRGAIAGGLLALIITLVWLAGRWARERAAASRMRKARAKELRAAAARYQRALDLEHAVQSVLDIKMIG
jgi:hypothetical protein